MINKLPSDPVRIQMNITLELSSIYFIFKIIYLIEIYIV